MHARDREMVQRPETRLPMERLRGSAISSHPATLTESVLSAAGPYPFQRFDSPAPGRSTMDAPDSPSPDRELVARIRAGDEHAFEAVFRTHYDGLCRFAAGIVGSDAEAEELAQEMLLRIWRQREDLMIAGSLPAYLYAAIRNGALNRLRRGRAEQRWRDQVTREGDVPHHGGAEPARADDDLRSTELAAAIERAVDELPPRRRQAYVLRRQHHLSYAEIAAVMEIAPKTVEIQIGAALKTLRQKLAEWL